VVSTQPLSQSQVATGRDPFLDVLRSVAMACVVFNHYVFVFYVWDPTGGFTKKIQDMGHAWVTWPFVFELAAFFFVGGAVIHRSAAEMPFGKFVVKRVWRLSIPFVAALASGLVVGLLYKAMAVPACKPGNGSLLGVVPYLACPAQFWLEPLWYMLVFIPLTVLSPLLVRARGRARWLLMGGAIALVALSDLVRFSGGSALPVSELAWLVPWLLGFAYADGTLLRIPRRVLIGASAAALAVTVVGIGWGPWSSVLGSYPRSLETVAQAFISIPLLVAFRATIGSWSDRGPVGWCVRVVGPRMMSIFVWHAPAMAIVVAAVAALEVELAGHVGALWLLQKLPWALASLGVLWLLLKLVEPIESIRPPRRLVQWIEG
jgi:peptidoglycan/LPS O-acetylase OafA/YrhL